jgi:predicted DNA-binding transcriptional regulator AlpA
MNCASHSPGCPFGDLLLPPQCFEFETLRPRTSAALIFRNIGTARRLGAIAMVSAAVGGPDRHGVKETSNLNQEPTEVLRLADIAKYLRVSRRAIERERAAGRFPAPCRVIGARVPVWTREQIRAYLGAA